MADKNKKRGIVNEGDGSQDREKTVKSEKSDGCEHTDDSPPRNAPAILQALVENLQQGVLFESSGRRILFTNQSFCNLFGLPSPDAILGADCALIAEQAKHAFTDPDAFIRNIELRLAERKTLLSEELSLVDGRTIERDYIPVVAGNEQPGNFWIYRDITERRRAEKALKESETRLRMVTENAPDIIVELDSNGHIMFMSRVLEGFNLSDVIGRDFCNWVPQKYHAIVRCTLEQAFRTGEPQEFETQGSGAHGETRWYMSRISPIKAGGQVSRVILVARDITERRQAKERLQAREKQLADSQRIAHIGSWEHNLTTGKVFWSDELFRLLGLDPKTDPADFGMFFEMIHPDDRPNLSKAIDATVRLGKPFSIEYRFVYRNGEVRIIHARAELIHDESGTQNILSGTGQDITERIRTEEMLRKSEESLREAQQLAHIGNWSYDVLSQNLWWSEELYRIFEVDSSTAPLTSELLLAKIHPEDQARFKEEMAAGQPSRSDYRVLFADGRIKYIHEEVKLQHDNGGTVVRYTGTAQDVTDRKIAEAALKESEKRLRTLIDAIPDAVVFKDAAGHHIIANRANEEVLGLSPEMLIGKTVEDLLPPDEAATCRKNDEEVMKKRKTVRDEEHMAGKDGATRIIDTIKVPLYDDSGKAMGLVGIIRDITERKQAEEKIRQSEQFIRGILDTVDEGFIVVDRDYRILTANKAYCSQIGGCDKTIIGRHCYEISHKNTRPCYEEGEECATRRAFETGTPHSALHRHKDANDNILYVETKAFPIKDVSGAVTSVIETINNITERHLLEEERLKTQKLESIGTLAGGIAHDFNNLLQGIFGYISMAKMSVDRRDKALAMLEQAENALHQSVNLTTQLLTFSKGGKPIKKPVDLRPVVENAVRFTLSGSRSDFRVDAAEDLWQAEADEGQIGQVVQNIVLNADQAMPLGGLVTVTARNAAEGDASLPPGLVRGNYIVLSIDDAGVGIPAQYLDKIFDPYFTTKEKGSGLGLATAYSIVRNHGGMIDVRTKPGEGSAFTIYLPAIVGRGRLAAAVVPASSPQRAARILVMDDEEIIRTLSRELINALGHEVDVAKHGEEALEKYQTAIDAGIPFDIVILDLTVRGGMGGTETIQKLREIDPAVKAIVSSGYSDDAAIANHPALGFKAYLKKPYNIEQLRQALNPLLA